MKVKVLTPIDHNNTRYETGEEFEMNDEVAKPLIDDGVLGRTTTTPAPAPAKAKSASEKRRLAELEKVKTQSEDGDEKPPHKMTRDELVSEGVRRFEWKAEDFKNKSRNATLKEFKEAEAELEGGQDDVSQEDGEGDQE